MRCLGCPSAAAAVASIRSLPSVSNGRFDGGGGGGDRGDYHYRTQSLWVSMSGGDGDGGGGHSRIMGHYCCAMIPILSLIGDQCAPD